MDNTVIFEKSRKHARAHAQIPTLNANDALPVEFLREDSPLLPELSELEVVRHFTTLSQKNYSIDGQFYPLGSCTMKYNPRGVHQLAGVRPIKNVHPLMPERYSQGFLKCLYELQQYLLSITGMQGISLTPMA
ncbi:MAG TPA: aminomethyl-transferring glycine dehydrogenase subunit GcvPB, partial [Gammaproteobacteria bacterium]|nr:aminomethyl-transferring glycine dehydrogenase subunit GcvPB [Gammaproteobacteria bacterium]